MASRNVNKLLALARTSLIGAATGTGQSISDILESSTPGFGFLQAFFATWLKLDITTLAAALTIFGTISTALKDLQGVAFKIYWWITKFFTASISISSSDRLNREILNWLGAQVLERQATRILTARTETIHTDAWHPRRQFNETKKYMHEKRVPIQYLPTFGTTWFFHDRNIFLVRRVSSRGGNYSGVPEEYAAAPEGDEPLVVMCLGRSVAPIKRFLDTCRNFSEKEREAYITIRACKTNYGRDAWETTVLRPIRPLATVHFDENTKSELVADIKNYLDSNTRKFYMARGIPYRRGYLLHGPPGTGKTPLPSLPSPYFASCVCVCVSGVVQGRKERTRGLVRVDNYVGRALSVSFLWNENNPLALVSRNNRLLRFSRRKEAKGLVMPWTQRTPSVREKKLQSRLAKLAEDENRKDGGSIKDTALDHWIAPPVSWSYEHLLAIAIRRFREFLEIMGPKDARITVTDPQEYFRLGAQLFSLELIKLFILYLARTSAGTLDDKITGRTMQGYITHTIAAAYRCTGKKQLENEERKQVYVYIASLVRDGELSNKTKVKPVSTRDDLDLLIDAVFSDAFSLRVKSIRVVLNLALYMNLFVDVCGRGSDLAWGGLSVAEKESHCLCWNHCHFFVVNVEDGDRVIAANIDIKYQKGMRNLDQQKTVSLRLLPANMAMHDSLRLLLTLAFADGVFGPGVTWSSILSIDPGVHSREIQQSSEFMEVPVFRSARGQTLRSGKLGDAIVGLGKMVGFKHNATPYTLRRGYANLLYLTVSAEDRKFLMGHKTNSEIYSHYHSAISDISVQKLFREVRATNDVKLHSLSLNRVDSAPQTISAEGWQRVQQDPEIIQYSLETSQISSTLSEEYGSLAAAVRSSDPRIADFRAATARLKNRRRVLLGSVYNEEYRKLFAYAQPQDQTPSPSSMVIVDQHPEADPRPLDDDAAAAAAAENGRDWLQQLEEEEECARELVSYDTITAEDSPPTDEEIGGPDSSEREPDDDIMQMPRNHPPASFLPPQQLSEESETTRLHKINDGSAVPKNMSITRVREMMSSGGLADAALSNIMVEVFSATHNSGKYIPGEEPLLGTSTCRFSDADLSLAHHAAEAAHSAHAAFLTIAAQTSFEEHLLPLNTPCAFYAQGPTKKKNPRLCEFNRFTNRRQQIHHVHAHTLKINEQHHAAGNIPQGEWHCFHKDCATVTPTPAEPKKVAKVLLRSSSVFTPKQSFLSHLYQDHRLSPCAIEPVLWCGMCEHFLEWDQFGATATDEHFARHWDEVWSLIMAHGYAGQYDGGRRTIPSFCPFCLHNENLSPTERISKTMNLLGQAGYKNHIASHFDGVHADLLLLCPCFPNTCSDPAEMTPADLTKHLRSVHGVDRAEISRVQKRANAQVLAEKSANLPGGMGEGKLLKKARA